ncbi:MAG: DUF4399 domain-containing protein [Gammaproteobacteria bacterium]
MRHRAILATTYGLLLCAALAKAEEHMVYIIAPLDGTAVQSPVLVQFGLKNPWGVAPAGTALANTGHHHLLIDTDLPDLTQAIPKDEHHQHFGGGQTEALVDLRPGRHTLQLLLGDFAHVPHAPPVISERITITVE